MAFNTVGIQDNLPVLPIHVLQIIQSLTEFGQTYSAEDFFREGRTNFGAAEFTSSAHVEMHSYNGADPLVVYSGQYNDTEVFSIDVNGTTSVTSLTGSNATITTLAVANEAVINSAITTATVNTATIQTATVSNLYATNGVISTLNSNVGAIATFTASNAQVTNTATVTNLTVNNTANIDTANITDAIITTGTIDDLTSTNATIDTVDAVDVNISNDLTVDNDATVSNNLTVSNDVNITNNLTVGGLATAEQVEIDYTNTNYTNTGGANSHILLNNTSATGQSVISSVINGKLTGKLRNDYVGNINYVASGSGNHYFFTQGDYPSGNVRLAISSSGRVGIGTSTPTTTLDVVGNVKAVSFTGSFSGSFAGAIVSASYVETAQTASYANLVAGPGITTNGLAITASVRTVNGISPTNGNIAVSLAGVLTGTSASLISSGSGAVTASISNGALWVISGDGTPANNGDAYIYNSGSVGQWLPVAPLDTAAGDARYVLRSGLNYMTGDLDLDGNDVINGGTFYGTAETASFVTASNVYGPYGASSVVSASHAVSSSYAVSASWAPSQTINTANFITTGSISTTQTVTGSLRVSGSLTTTGSIFIRDNTYATNTYAGTFQPYNGFYGIIPLNPNDINTTASAAPSWWASSNGSAIANGGPGKVYLSDQNIGQYGLFDTVSSQPWAGALKFLRDNSNTVVNTGKVPYHTLITNNATVTDNNATFALTQANGRSHVLTVTGSMLARDSVSLGTNLTNKHIITGSVNMTGSLILNGTNLGTLVSPIQSVDVTLTQSDILTLTTPKVIIPAPAIGYGISPISMVAFYKFGTQPYVVPNNIELRITNNVYFSTTIPNYPGDYVLTNFTQQFNGQPAWGFDNTPMVAVVYGTAPSGGDGILRFRVFYTVIPLT